MTTATCTYAACNEASTTSADAAEVGAWMDQHVAEAPHPSEWPVTFRLDYPGYSLPSVAYRAAVAIEAPQTGEGRNAD